MPVRAVENAQNAFSTAPTGINNVLPMSSDNFVTHVSGGPGKREKGEGRRENERSVGCVSP
jgi:hypothetical protein